MSGSKWKTGTVVSAALLAGLFVVNLLVDSGGTEPAGASGLSDGCTEKVHYYSADVEQNFFGPPANGEVPELRKELNARRCKDPALVVAHAHTWAVPGFEKLEGDAQFAAKIRELRDNPMLWAGTILGLEERENASTASVTNMSGQYDTLYMLDGITDVPLIRKAQPDRPSFAVLRFAHPSGYVVNYKLDCGFQSVGQFPGVPPVDTPPPPDQPGPTPTCVELYGREACNPTTTSTTTSTTTTSTTVPPCPYNRNLPRDHPDCKPPIDNGRGGPADPPTVAEPQPTPGAGTEPARNPQGPTPREGQPAPDPVEGGYDSGSPDGSGTPDGSTCDANGCTGGGSEPAEPGTPPTVDNDDHEGDPGGFA